MSLKIDVNSNLSLVRRFHTMEKIVKMCQFYSDSSRFFFCNQLYYEFKQFFLITLYGVIKND
jgi:hypothetical protein